MMEEKAKVLYAIPCAFGYPSEGEEDSLFFLTFQTKNEREAYRLASCVCGRKGKNALVIISENGEIFQL
jgi:hypothetical protein